MHGNPRGNGKPWYPLELVQAVAMLWLFAGLRVDEILRLPIGAVRWQASDERRLTTTRPVCLLDIPTNKTGTAFTKPVDPLPWPQSSKRGRRYVRRNRRFDRKTGEATDLLFACRAIPVARTYINATIIPMLCRKAGVSHNDVRGRITSHRARATIASQLYNAKEPMTLFELQAWLGHRSPETTQHYAQITPNTLTKAYTDAGYFARNVRTIEVLIDREAVLMARRLQASLGSTTISVTATAAIRSLSSVRTGWLAHAAISIFRSEPLRRRCSKPRRLSGGWR